jgi:hypothetical protein
MQQRHLAQLLELLEQVALDGAATLRWEKVYLWFGVERIRKSVYAGIQEQWDDLWAAHWPKASAPALMARQGETCLILIRGGTAGEEFQVSRLQEWI